jgi:hypothetical protein
VVFVYISIVSAATYAKEIEASQEAQDAASGFRLRAERRLGELLESAPKNKGAKGSKVTGSKREPVRNASPTLADIGITKKLSSSAQMLARVSKERKPSP